MEDLKTLDLLALMPCPLKVPFESVINNYVEKINKNISVEIIANVNNHMISKEKIYERLYNTSNIDELPEIIISPGINHLYYEKFRKKFIYQNLFENYLKETHKIFKDIGYIDKDNNYTMFTMNILVIVIDKRNLKQLEIPTSWDNLLDERYKNKIVIRGRNNKFCETVLLNIYKDYGQNGLNKLAKNVKLGCHPSQMIKLIQDKKNTETGIYIMPYFFAKTVQEINNIEIIWPKEGGVVNAISMLIKRNTSDNVKALANFILSDDVGNIFANAGFPVANSKVDNKLTNKQNLKWLGWDYIKKFDMENEIKMTNQIFSEKFYN